MPPTVPTRPAGGGNVASDWGQWAHDWLAGRDFAQASASLTCTTAYQDVAGMTKTLPAGWYIVFVVAHLAVGASGVGDVDAVLNVGGVDQPSTARWSPAATVTGDATVCQMYMIQLASTSVVKVRGKKSVSAGTATVIASNSRMFIL